MRQLTMSIISGRASDVTVTIDEDQPVDSGAYGTIFAVDGVPNVVVKRLDVDPPTPVATIRDYMAHITVTRQRLDAIMNEERRQSAPRAFIIEFITEILAYSLSTHWACDLTNGMEIRAVWLLQRRASGKSLREHFDETPRPSAPSRKRIAKHFLRRMRTLRRADLVHLDCVPDNIFYDHASDRLTMIDLDGCGIIRRNARGPGYPGNADEWEHYPVTIGRTKQVRVPPWYPQPGLQLSPKKGNYVFAERWVVLDTVIRILTWGKMAALAWLPDPKVRTELGNAYKTLTNQFLAFRTANPDAAAAADWWLNASQNSVRTLRVQFRDAMPPPNASDWTSRGDPVSMTYFADVAQQAFFEPPILSTPVGTAPLYDVFSRRLG